MVTLNDVAAEEKAANAGKRVNFSGNAFVDANECS
jgi:hypothetical protein